MSAVRKRLVQEAASRGKYAPLNRHLAALAGPEWSVSFKELEAILGFELSVSARLYRPLWSSQNRGAGQSHALAWHAAGWKTRAVDLEAETLVFERVEAASGAAEVTPRRRQFHSDEHWPAIPSASWPPGFMLSREQIHDEFGRLTCGPQDELGHSA